MKFRCVGKLNIAGKKWEVGYGNPGKGNDGICDYDKQRITIAPNRRVRGLANVVAHEVIHARLPDVSEESVESTACLIEIAIDLLSESNGKTTLARG